MLYSEKIEFYSESDSNHRNYLSLSLSLSGQNVGLLNVKLDYT